MKHYAILLFICLLVAHGSPAQGFDRDHKLLSVTGSYTIFGYAGGPFKYDTFPTPVSFIGARSFQLNVEGEYPISKYFGLGYSTGVGVGKSWSYYGSLTVVNVPIIGILNFHYYQLIADKAKKHGHSDKLDLWIGVSAGTGIGVFPSEGKLGIMVVAAVQTGFCYYIKPNIGIRADYSLGFAKLQIGAGVTFKMNRKKRAVKQ